MQRTGVKITAKNFVAILPHRVKNKVGRISCNIITVFPLRLFMSTPVSVRVMKIGWGEDV
jgi:hypothetical protein